MVVGLFGISFVSNAESIKGKGVGISQFDSDTDICGLMPCSDYPGGNGFDSDFMSGDAEFEHTFEVPGEYDYYCQLHPWMIGSITVE